MLKSMFLITILTVLSLHAQEKWSLEVNAGLVIPNEAENGIGLSFKPSYNISKNISFYTSLSNLSYDFRKRIIASEGGLKTFDEEKNHSYYSLSFGTVWYLIDYENLSPFLLGEVGLGHLEYDKHCFKEFYLLNNEIGTLVSDSKSTEEKKFLYNLGIGFGVLNKLSESIDVNLTIKFLSLGGKDYLKIGDENSFYTQILAGIKYNL